MNTGNRKGRFYFIVLFLLFINLSLIVINFGIWVIAVHQKYFITADFTNFYTGFQMVLNGEGSKLYDLDLQTKYQQDIMGDINFEGGLLPYLNPPFIALLFSPLSFLPISAAYFSWTIMEIGLLIWLIVLINHLFSDWTKQERIIMTITILAFWPLTITFLLGQFSLLFLVCMLQMYIAMRQSNLGKAGLWLVVLLIKPQTLPIPGVMTLNKRYWSIAFTAAIACIAVIIISIIFLGFGVWTQYIHVLSTMSQNFGKLGFIPGFQYTLRGILTNILGYSRANVINIISSGAFLAGVICVWLFWMKGVPPDSQRFTLYFAFTILLSAFLSLHLYPHDDLILVLPAALFYDYLRGRNAPRKVFSLIILVSPVIFFIATFTNFNLFGVLRPPVVIILSLLSWIVYYLILDHRNETRNQPKGTLPTIPSFS